MSDHTRAYSTVWGIVLVTLEEGKTRDLEGGGVEEHGIGGGGVLEHQRRACDFRVTIPLQVEHRMDIVRGACGTPQRRRCLPHPSIAEVPTVSRL